MNKIVTTFSLFTNGELDVSLLKRGLPTPNRTIIKGQSKKKLKLQSPPIPKETSTSYKVEYHNIYYLEEVNNEIFHVWSEHYGDVLTKLKHDHGVHFHLHYEITSSKDDFPSISFEPKITKFFGNFEIEVSIEFYD